MYFLAKNSTFGSDSIEECSHFVGITENVSYAIAFKILKDNM